MKKIEERTPLAARLTRRSLLRNAGALGIAAGVGGPLMIACTPTSTGPSQSSPTAAPTEAVKRGGTLVEGQLQDMAGFNPIVHGFTNLNSIITSVLFEGLLSIDKNGNPQPLLAQALPTVSSDGMTYTFKLVPGVNWSDGRPLTAEDVAFTYRLCYAPEYKEVNFIPRAQAETYIESVTASDPATVVMKLKKPYAAAMSVFGHYGVLPKHVLGTLAAKDINTADFNSNPTVTSGPFTFSQWVKGDRVVLKRNEKHRNPPLLDQYVYRVIGTAQAIVSQLQTGEIDFGPVPATMYDQVKAATKVKRLEYDGVVFWSVMPNLDPAKRAGRIFADQVVRQALYYAIDREAIRSTIYQGLASAPTTFLWPGSAFYKANPKNTYAFDLKKAEELLDGAGWVKGADGTRRKGSDTLTFEYLNATIGLGPQLAQYLQEQWRKIGVTITLKTVDGPTLVRQLMAGDFEIAIYAAGWQADPDSMLQHFVIGAGANYGKYNNKTVSDNIVKAAATTDQATRKEIYGEIQDTLSVELPQLFLSIPRGIYGYNERVQALDAVGPFNVQLPRAEWLRKVWVTDGK